MPIIPQPVNDYAVLKSYLVFLMETTENLELKHIFTHCDEAVYSKLLKIIWKHGTKYAKIIPLLGGFHQVLCLLKIIYKRYACLGLDKWVTAAGTTKSASSAEKPIQCSHYNTSMRVYKEVFDAIVQMRVEDLTSTYAFMDKDLLNKFVNLRKNVCIQNVDEIINTENFEIFQKDIIATTGTVTDDGKISKRYQFGAVVHRGCTRSKH